MKSLFKVAGIILAALFAVSMFASATASAAPHWEKCSTGGTATKYTTSECGTASSGGTFQWNELTSTEAARTKGSLLLKDTAALINSQVECSGESIGSVGPGKFGRVDKIEVSPAQCRVVRGCGTLLNVKAVHLPWQTELYESEKGVILQALSSTGAGEPGWEVECEAGGTVVADKCEQGAGTQESILLANKATGTELLVLGTFQHLRKANCSAGGKEKGEVVGALAGLISSTVGLRVSS